MYNKLKLQRITDEHHNLMTYTDIHKSVAQCKFNDDDYLKPTECALVVLISHDERDDLALYSQYSV